LNGADTNPVRPSRIYPGLPPFGSGQRIGLYGGSFNPPHGGHRQIALIALHRLKLDAIWWLVTPGNPLKENDGLEAPAGRMEAAARLAAHPRMVVSGLETRLNTRFTADMAEKLTRRVKTVRFVWLMGSDNLAGFHCWDRWRDIADHFPIAVINRPGSLTAPLNAPAAQALARYRIEESAGSILAECRPPAWIFITGPRTSASSTGLRNAATGPRKES